MITKQKTVPELRFQYFEEPWRQERLGTFGKVSMCKRVFKEQTQSKGDIPFFKIGTFGKTPDAFISADLYEEFRSKYSYPKVGDILISAAGTIGRTVVFDGVPAYFQDSNIVWIDNDEEEVLNRFLLYCYENTRWTTEDTTIARLYNDNLKQIFLSFPTLPEQRKISGFLTAVDGRIGQLSQKKALLEDYKKGVMQQLFTQALRFKDDHGNDFPEWGEKTLGDIGKITTGKTPSTSDDAAWIGSTMFVTPTDIGEDTKFQRSTKRHVNGEKLRLISKHSLMFTCIASVGKMSIATEPCITNQQINSVSVNSGYFFEFIYYALRYLTPQIKATQANTTLPIINKTEFSKFLLPIPSFPEQTKIANFLTALDRKIESVSSQITGMQTWKKGLLQQMFV
jgi:type I restriction enzyme S subunit